MKTRSVLLAVTVLAAGAVGATTVTGRARPFDPPTAGQLALSGDAATQWNMLRAETIALRDRARDLGEDRLQRLQVLLAEPAPDLDAFRHDSERRADALLEETRALAARRLAWYAALPADDQARIRAELGRRVERLLHLRAALAEFGEAGS